LGFTTEVSRRGDEIVVGALGGIKELDEAAGVSTGGNISEGGGGIADFSPAVFSLGDIVEVVRNVRECGSGGNGKDEDGEGGAFVSHDCLMQLFQVTSQKNLSWK